jgi:hypothetical protein
MLKVSVLVAFCCVAVVTGFPRRNENFREVPLESVRDSHMQLTDSDFDYEPAESQTDLLKQESSPEVVKSQKMKAPPANGNEAKKSAANQQAGADTDGRKSNFIQLPKFLSFGMGYPYGPAPSYGWNAQSPMPQMQQSPCYRPRLPKCGCQKRDCCDPPMLIDEEDDAPADYMEYRRKRRYRGKNRQDDDADLEELPANVELIKKAKKLNKEKDEQDFDYWYNARMNAAAHDTKKKEGKQAAKPTSKS